MTRRIALMPLMVLALSGCSYFFPEDPREGEEPVDQCAARLATDMALIDFRNVEDQTAQLVPTYTYDITKMDFVATQELIEPGADETLGRRLISQTNEISTARAQFMDTDVDEKGAFFFGQHPSLWRVRGERLPYDEIINAGCERQQSGMRLIAIDVATSVPEPDPEEEGSETESSGDGAQ